MLLSSGEGGLCPAEDAGDVALGLLIAPGVLFGLLLVPAAWVRHGSIYLRVGLGAAEGAAAVLVAPVAGAGDMAAAAAEGSARGRCHTRHRRCC